MSNKEIANAFNLLAKLMELHDENPYKTKSYSKAYRILRGVSEPLKDMSLAELKGIRGVGDAISRKIQELQANGKMRILEEYLEMTPKGVVDLMGIKGLGVKKILTLWKELEVESPGELLYACHENRLVTLNGFGAKTQENIKKQLEYYFQSKDRYRWASLVEDAEDLLLDLQEVAGDDKVALTGQFRRQLPVVDALEYVVAGCTLEQLIQSELFSQLEETEQHFFHGRSKEGNVEVKIYPCIASRMGFCLLQTTGSQELIKDMLEDKTAADFEGMTEKEIFAACEHPYLPPEVRDHPKIYWKTKNNALPELVTENEMKGVLHVHTNYSDGANPLTEIVQYVREQGYSYLGITDHSQSAFYANGLKPDRLEAQWAEIAEIQADLDGFTIFKGIESDIKYDGNLDYLQDTLEQFDFVIASVHAHLKMTKEKATERLLAAIRNPYTTILGHPTGRLLLSREGYPIDHQAVIDACAKHQVIIELNANPHRLDLDYEWIPYALEQGVKIAINPDAHSLAGVHDIRYGVQVARKALLGPENCVNCWSVEEFSAWLQAKKQARGA